MTTTRLARLLFEQTEPHYVVAAQCGLSPTTLSQYARGKLVIRPQHAHSLSEYFGVGMEDVMGFEEERTSA